MFLFKLFMGLKNALALIPKRRGRLYVTTDSGELYADVSNTQRKQIGYSQGDIDFRFNSAKDYVDNAVASVNGGNCQLTGEYVGEGEYEGDGTFTWRLNIEANSGTAVIIVENNYNYGEE